jgi:hypothetical protein
MKPTVNQRNTGEVRKFMLLLSCTFILKCAGQTDWHSDRTKEETELLYSEERWFLVYVLVLLRFVACLVICLPNS